MSAVVTGIPLQTLSAASAGYTDRERKIPFLERRPRNSAHDVVLPGDEHPPAPLGTR